MGQAASVSGKEPSLATSQSLPVLGVDANAQEKGSVRHKSHSNKEELKGVAHKLGSKDEYDIQIKESTVVDDGDSDDDNDYGSLPSRSSIRRQSLADFMKSSQLNISAKDQQEVYIFNPNSDQITVGDVVRVIFADPSNPQEGIVIEKVNKFKLKVDFGDSVRECLLENCAIIIRSDEFEVGDKVEARPVGGSLFFVGKVIKVHEDKSIDVLMDGDDQDDDIEYGIPAEDARKLMSRRSVVVNRWKKAFMMVIAVNMFKRIRFRDPTDAK